MNISGQKLLVGVACVAMSLGGLGGPLKSAQATPATLGFYPASDIYDKGTFHLDVDSYGRNTKMDAVTSVGLTGGLGGKDGVFGRTEIGVDYLMSAGGGTPVDPDTGNSLSGSRRLTFNAKTQLYNNEDKGLRVVAGVWGVGSKKIYAPNVAYVLGAKSFDWGRVHVGMAHSLARKETIATPAGNDDRTFLHLAYDRPITKKLSFAVDWYSGKSAISGVQPSLYYAVNDKASFGVGLMRFNDKSVTPTRNQLYLCFDYNFGKSGSAEPAAPATP
jgi:hypothetical protein